MPVALIVEDGTGQNPAANSYASLADALTYHTNNYHLNVWQADGVTDDQRSAALIRATQYIDGYYGGGFVGLKKYPLQPLMWPRLWAIDYSGWLCPGDRVHPRARDATCEMALRTLNDIVTGVVTVNVDLPRSGAIRRQETRVDVLMIATEWSGGAPGGTLYPEVTAILWLILDSGGAIGSVKLARG